MYYKIKYNILKTDGTVLCTENYLYITNIQRPVYMPNSIPVTIDDEVLIKIEKSKLTIDSICTIVREYNEIGISIRNIVSINIIDIDLDSSLHYSEFEKYLNTIRHQNCVKNKTYISTNIVDNFISIGHRCHYVVDSTNPELDIKMIAVRNDSSDCLTCYIHCIRSTKNGNIDCSKIKCSSAERNDGFNIHFELLS